jgi:hypothetical protein
MPVAHRDIALLVRIVLLYLPPAPARQMLSELYKTKAAEANKSLHETLKRMMHELDGLPRRGNQMSYAPPEPRTLPPEWHCAHCNYGEYVWPGDEARAAQRKEDHEKHCTENPVNKV